MIPNIIYSIRHKEAFENNEIHKCIVILEQIARYGCIALIIFNIPMTYTGYWFSNASMVYMIVNGVFISFYLLAWVIPWKSKIVRAAILSFLPAFIFIFSGIMILSIPLIVFSVIFAVTHIYISIKNSL